MMLNLIACFHLDMEGEAEESESDNEAVEED